MADKIIERLSCDAGLMHQPGSLCDVTVVRAAMVESYDILSVDHVRDSEFSSKEHYCTLLFR